MVQILVNMKPATPLQPIEGTITSLVILSLGQTLIPKEMTKPFASWLYDISQRVEGAIIFNNTIIDKKDVNDVANQL